MLRLTTLPPSQLDLRRHIRDEGRLKRDPTRLRLALFEPDFVSLQQVDQNKLHTRAREPASGTVPRLSFLRIKRGWEYAPGVNSVRKYIV